MSSIFLHIHQLLYFHSSLSGLDSIFCHYNHYLGKTLNPQYSVSFTVIPLGKIPFSLHWHPSSWVLQEKNYTNRLSGFILFLITHLLKSANHYVSSLICFFLWTDLNRQCMLIVQNLKDMQRQEERSPLLTLSCGPISVHKESHCLLVQLSREGLYITVPSLYTPSQIILCCEAVLTVHCRMLSNIPALLPYSPVQITKTISRYCQMSLG